ncbi:MAG: nuclear transport factor 2 family protein [Rhodothermales bacterium]|nr:nuclear transport factor 2 family protein [Rhodothermales bacterium]
MKQLCLPLLTLLLAVPALAQSDLDALRAQFERGIETGDADLIAMTFAEPGVFTPIAGGLYEGRDAIRAMYQQDPIVQSANAEFSTTPDRTEYLTDDLIHEIGTFSLVVPTAEGERRIEGEYATVATRVGGEWKIRHLTSFPPRRMPARAAAPTQDEIDAVLRRVERAYNEGTPDDIVALYTDDAVFRSVLGPTLKGREAVRDFFASLPPDALPEGARLRLTADHAELLGDLLYLTGTWAWTTPGGEAVMEGEYVDLMKWEDGAWKEHRLTTFHPRGKPDVP